MTDRLSLPVPQWPEPDRLAWERALTPDDPLFGEGGAAARRRPATRKNYAYGYGQFLTFLLRCKQLDHAEQPSARVTHARLNDWVAEMQ